MKCLQFQPSCFDLQAHYLKMELVKESARAQPRARARINSAPTTAATESGNSGSSQLSVEPIRQRRKASTGNGRSTSRQLTSDDSGNHVRVVSAGTTFFRRCREKFFRRPARQFSSSSACWISCRPVGPCGQKKSSERNSPPCWKSDLRFDKSVTIQTSTCSQVSQLFSQNFVIKKHQLFPSNLRVKSKTLKVLEKFVKWLREWQDWHYKIQAVFPALASPCRTPSSAAGWPTRLGTPPDLKAHTQYVRKRFYPVHAVQAATAASGGRRSCPGWPLKQAWAPITPTAPPPAFTLFTRPYGRSLSQIWPSGRLAFCW